MADNSTPPRSLFFLRAGWNCFLDNREVVVLLSLLTAMITLAIPSPMRDLIIGGDAAVEALLESPQVLAEAAPSLAMVWVVLLVTGSLISVVLARTIVLGRGRAMDGGWQSLVWRGFRVVMKALSALFFIILFALPSFFLVGLIANQAGAGANMILAVALMLWMVVVATVVTAAYYAAVLAESTDRPSGIVKGWDALKGKLWDLCGAILILWIVFLLVAGIIDPIITFGTGLMLAEGLARALSFSVTTVLGGILGFVLMAATFFVLGVISPGFLGPAPAPIPINPDDD